MACSGPRGSYLTQDFVKALTDQWIDTQIKTRDTSKYRKRGSAGVHGLDTPQDAPWTWPDDYGVSAAYWTSDYDYGYPTEYPADYQYEEYTHNEEEEELAAAIDMVAEDAQQLQTEDLKPDLGAPGRRRSRYHGSRCADFRRGPHPPQQRQGGSRVFPRRWTGSLAAASWSSRGTRVQPGQEQRQGEEGQRRQGWQEQEREATTASSSA